MASKIIIEIELEDLLKVLSLSNNQDYSLALLTGKKENYFRRFPKIMEDVTAIVKEKVYKSRKQYLQSAYCKSLNFENKSFNAICVYAFKEHDYESKEDFQKRYSSNFIDFSILDDNTYLVTFIETFGID